MKVGIISDIHENFHNLILFLEKIEKYNIEKIIFLGDFMNNGVAKILANSKVPVISIWGNNDGDKVAITKTALSENSNLKVGFDTFDFLEIEKRKIFISHYPILAKPMAKSGDFDAVFYGHDHKVNIDKIGNCLIVNPGEISAHKTSKASFAIYDSETNLAEIIFLENVVTIKTDKSDKFMTDLNSNFSNSKTHQY